MSYTPVWNKSTSEIFSFNIKKGIDILNREIIDIELIDAICVTTNGVVKSNGELVMGAGVAKQFAQAIPGISKALGSKVRTNGNHVYVAGTYKGQAHHKYKDCDFGKIATVLSFPTKHHYNSKADLDLIIASAKRLVKWADKTGAKSIWIPSPGTGLGGLKPNDVYSALNGILDKRFTIVTK